ncbi:hypothetical protein EJ02DRAFT_386260 [Clathrospora elynae]|uniref:Fork-head domain-containing protein n=1 Tax=Clathrospora elynae TaxID=706981 RepID=A0A6A5SBS0_9PLEO|nr:hypothetical protein EJ02DRAFT_386260 [Clathrospora elynae]
MVVVSPDQLHHDVAPHDDTPAGPFLSASNARIPDMAAAALPALPLGGEGAPADHAMMDLPLLDAPIAFAQQDPNAADLSGDALNGLSMKMAPEFAPLDMAAFAQPIATRERLTAYARLRFDDGSYYMHTCQIVLGRNVELARRDMRRLAVADQLHAEGRPQDAADVLSGKQDKKKRRGRRGARSVISEKGGIVNAPMKAMPLEYQQRRHSNASHSLSSGSNPNGAAAEDKAAERAPQNMIMQAFPEVPPQFDGDVPEDPDDCPFVPIHPQHIIAKTGAQGPKGISREHAKIFFDSNVGHFCIHVLGNNGLFHEGQFLARGTVAPLDHGDHLMIGAVNVHFFLPDVALTDDQRHRQESGSRPMSFSFENGRGQLESDEHITSESDGEQSINPRHVYYHHPVDSDIDSEDGAGDDAMDDYEEPAPRPRKKQSLKLKIKNLPPPPSKKETKKAHKRKHLYREATPEEPPTKKLKVKVREPTKIKEPTREPVKEPKEPKEPKVKEPRAKEPKEAKDPKEKELKEPREPKEKGKAPAKIPTKTPAKTTVKAETPVEEPARETPVVEKVEQPSKPVPNDSPPLLRKPLEGELEAGDIDGLITEEMAAQHNLPRNLVGHVVEKRKGPGRPPKDGIMSKRQRSQLIKQAKEIEKARAAGIDPADIPVPTIKPKAPKRKESNAAEGEDEAIMETTEQGDGTVLGAQRQNKPIKPPRTPSPEMRMEDYTEEQLARPSVNYVVIIHEAISSAPNGQMNLQQIYMYIEKKYPWYKFKTTTSGWQSSVRHNLGQHDAFVKGDKDGKGFNWRVNPEVSIEKERRKRQVSPPMNQAQRPQYYPPPNGYPPYPPSGYPYHPGMPHSMPPAAPRLPPSLSQPRLPPSMARESNAPPSAPQGAPHPSPYASPWGGGNAAGSPPAPNPPRPYPQPSSQTPPVSSAAGPSGQYGVLFPTAAPQSYSGPSAPSPYGGQQYATAGSSPYGPAPPRPYPTYPPPGQQQPAPSTHSSASPYPQPQPQGPPYQGPSNESTAPHPSGRYPLATHPDLIRQLEAFRSVYLAKLPDPDQETKVNNAIRAIVDSTVPEATLTESEKQLCKSICNVAGVAKHLGSTRMIKLEDAPTTAAGSTAMIAADAAANTVIAQQAPKQYAPPSYHRPSPAPGPQSNNDQPHMSISPAPAPQPNYNQPHMHMPNMTAGPSAPPPSSNAAPAQAFQSSHRPSVEPLTPVPGSPAVLTAPAIRD